MKLKWKLKRKLEQEIFLEKKFGTYFRPYQDAKLPAKVHNNPICRNERLLNYSLGLLNDIHRWSKLLYYLTFHPILLVSVFSHCNDTTVLST